MLTLVDSLRLMFDRQKVPQPVIIHKGAKALRVLSESVQNSVNRELS